MTTKAKTDPLEQTFKALADQTRLRILHLLRPGELCVCDLVACLDLPQPTVSRHLAYLRRAGLVEVRRDGHWIYYRLPGCCSPFLQKLFAFLGECCQECCQLGRDQERRENLKRSCC